jgi:sortase A
MKSKKTTILILLVLFVGLSLLLYPSVSNYWNSLHSSRAISGYQEAVSRLDTDKIEQMLQEAHAYNKKLFDDGYTLVLPEPRKESYFKLLDVTGTGIMGYIEIKKLGVYLPIYHGTSESVLQSAVGHIEGSFLPVGGENTHTVLSGHRGLPSAKLFTDLDKMLVGDVFTLRILNDVLTYEVDQILTVLPQELDALNVVKGEDLCTLITCTPYGINTHRLLVRGHRIETTEDAKTIRVPGDALRVSIGVVSVALAAPVLIALFILVLVRAPGGRQKAGKQKAGKQKQDK